MTAFKDNPCARAQDTASDAGATGIAADDMYRMSRHFCEGYGVLPLSVNGHRLLHALLHRTCRGLPEWSSDVRQPPGGHRARCVVLRRTLGLERSKSNRDLIAGIADLSETNIFEALEFEHKNTWLTWRFDDAILSCILNGSSYGLLDASALRTFRKGIDYQIFGQVSVVRRTRKAQFALTVEQVGLWMEMENARWSDVSTALLNAIRLSCAHYGLTAVVLLEGRGYLAGVDTVVVRLRRPGSFWSASELSNCSVWTRRCLLIDGSAQLRVTPAGLPDAVKRAKAVGWQIARAAGS